MLEIESTHIQELDDKMLRDLIGLLCEEELKKIDTGVRNVFWGGNQTAADGGIDVRCEYEGEAYSNSFIPRNKTGFQVKLSDYKPSQILNEMQDKGILKESIQDLCKNKGAYILVCGKSSVSDQMHKNRIDAMKKAVQGYEGSENVCLDFFDGNRIATWLRNYPALIIWVREKISRPLEGWRAYGEWSDTQEKDYKGYIIDEEKRLYDYMEDKEITVLEGIQKFRELINKGAAIIRLTGLSGVGKTRFLEELFDKNVGVDALDSSKVIYADAAETLIPCAEQMVRELILKNEKVIVVLDNCGAELHSVLMKICKTEETREVSLITVEYDVQEQNIEETETFVLKPASDVTIEELIVKNYKNIPLPTIKRIVEISGGNARLAFLFATSLLKYNKNINDKGSVITCIKLILQTLSPYISSESAASACPLWRSFWPTQAFGFPAPTGPAAPERRLWRRRGLLYFMDNVLKILQTKRSASYLPAPSTPTIPNISPLMRGAFHALPEAN